MPFVAAGFIKFVPQLLRYKTATGNRDKVAVSAQEIPAQTQRNCQK
jgi:hypothetical protein